MSAKQAQSAWDAIRRTNDELRAKCDDMQLAIDRCEETKTALHLNLRAMRDERDALAQQVEMMQCALADTAQTLAWTQHGTCRGFSEWLLSTNAALDNAKHALALPNTAADILRQRDARVLREAADIADQWGDARTDDHGGHALRNYAARIRNMAANLEAQHG